MGDAVQFPRLLTEREADAALGVSIDTLRRERKSGRLGYLNVRGRPRYLERHLLAYLDAQDVKPCESEPTGRGRSGTTGFPDAPIPPSGAAPGSTPPAARRVAHRLALTILQPPESPSPGGSRSTGTGPRSSRATC